jgi:isopentenyl-diphosphate delta-isomerase type 1
MTDTEEWFEVVDENGSRVAMATRRECHTNPALRHRVVHILVADARGRLYLQKRSQSKDIQPGKWDTSVGGHLRPNEQPEAAARRELAEELGIRTSVPLVFLHRYEWKSPVETELVDTFTLRWDGSISPDPAEIEAGRWWEPAEIRQACGRGELTPNFEEEFRRWCAFTEETGHE